MTTKRVIIAEKNVHSRAALAELLCDEGFAVVAVETGNEAIEEARRQAPAAVLVDIDLPGEKNGFRVIEEIKQVDSMCACFLVGGPVELETDAKSGVHFSDLSSRAKLAGADDYFSKPIHMETLVARLARVCERSP